MSDELRDFERRAAAREYAVRTRTDFDLAYEIAKLMPGEIILDEGERHITVWSIDDSYVIAMAWAPSEQDPTVDCMILNSWD